MSKKDAPHTRAQRIQGIVKEIARGISKSGQVNYNNLVNQTAYETGLTPKRVREYIKLILAVKPFILVKKAGILVIIPEETQGAPTK